MPPDTGIVHQVNLEYLARVVMSASDTADGIVAYPDTLVGTDSHTTMVNGLGVVGWGVGGIEAEAAMLGQPISMLIPPVLGFRLTGTMLEGATATDLVLTITERLRKHGVVGKFVEFFGPGLEHLTIADRATLGNMCPEYGATIAIFPIDEMTLDYLRLTGRDESQVAAGRGVREGAGAVPQRRRSRSGLLPRRIELDLATVEPSLAGPRRPQDRVSLKQAKSGFQAALPHADGVARRRRARRPGGSAHVSATTGGAMRGAVAEVPRRSPPSSSHGVGGHRGDHELHEHLESQRDDRRRTAGEEGGRARPDAQAVGEDQPGARVEGGDRVSAAAGSTPISISSASTSSATAARPASATAVRCPTTCSAEVEARNLVVASVLSGNRNFEGRIQQQVRANYLASPPLVVAYALAGRMTIDLTTEPLGTIATASRCSCATSGRRSARSRRRCCEAVNAEMFREQYADVFSGDDAGSRCSVPTGDRFAWDADSTYIRNPPFFEDLTLEPAPLTDITGRARAGAARRQHHDRSHLAGRIDQEGQPGRQVSDRARRRSRPISTRTARAAATTK